MKAAASTNASSSTGEAVPEKPERSLGQWAFDTLIYGGVINTTVFIASIIATYLTSHGRQFAGDSTSYFAGFSRWMNGRGERLDNWLVNKQWAKGPAGAEDLRMVAFSFADGTVFSMLAKPLESLRNPIARFVDRNFSSNPVDESTYQNEPKQSWGSVFGGRVLTFVGVISTYFGLRSLHVKSGDTFKNLNTALFTDPGRKLGEWVSSFKAVQKHFPKLTSEASIINLPGLFRVGLFEAFYTTLCTAGLWGVSRSLARVFGKKEKAPASPENETLPAATENAPPSAPLAIEHPSVETNHLSQSQEATTPADKPKTKIADAALLGRQSPVQSQLAGV